MYNEETIDFSGVAAAQNPEFLEPGMYRLKVDAANCKVVTPEGKTPYLSVKFVSEKGASVTEKFFLTAKALPRLQYLHEAWTSKRLDRAFKSMVEVGNYFQAFLTAKSVVRPMITGGKITADGKFYSGLPYTGFVLADESLFEEGAFDKDSVRYKSAVQIEKPNPAVAGSNAAVLPSYNELPAAAGNSADSPW
jgi:hypothetical protein